MFPSHKRQQYIPVMLNTQYPIGIDLFHKGKALSTLQAKLKFLHGNGAISFCGMRACFQAVYFGEQAFPQKHDDTNAHKSNESVKKPLLAQAVSN